MRLPTHRCCERSFCALLALVLPIALACGGPAAVAPEGAPAAPGASARVAPAAPAPYEYPPPVSGRYEEANLGAFELADGVAYPASDGSGTVVYVTSKAIASPLLAESGCPMTEARALTVLRDASYLEVTLDAKGQSAYFAGGAPYGGSSRETEVGGRYWQIQAKRNDGERVAGTLAYSGHGKVAFDLPVYRATVGELTEGDRVSGGVVPPGAVDPAPERIVATYRALRAAALQKDLAGILAAQGFDAARIEKIRGLTGIEADVAAFADRFLEPGETEEPQAWGGRGGVMGRGTNSKGESFANYYEFASCGDRLVLFGIGLNPQ